MVVMMVMICMVLNSGNNYTDTGNGESEGIYVSSEW